MTETIKQSVNRADINTLADELRSLGFGDMLRALPTSLRRKAPALATGLHPATEHAIILPTDAKAESIITAYAIAGTGTLGPLAVVAGVPAAGQCAVAPNGDLVFAAADVWLSVDVLYQPVKADQFTFTGAVVPGTGVMALPVPATSAGVVSLQSAVALVGTLTGNKEVVANGAVPATTLANLSLAKSQAQFPIADAVSSATVVLSLVAATDVNSILESTNTSFVLQKEDGSPHVRFHSRGDARGCSTARRYHLAGARHHDGREFHVDAGPW